MRKDTSQYFLTFRNFGSFRNDIHRTLGFRNSMGTSKSTKTLLSQFFVFLGVIIHLCIQYVETNPANIPLFRNIPIKYCKFLCKFHDFNRKKLRCDEYRDVVNVIEEGDRVRGNEVTKL